MSSSSPGDAQWTTARTNLRDWFAAHRTTQSELARLAGVNRSVISRFLEKEQPLSTASAIKLYSVLKLNLDSVERQQWMEWLHLERMQDSLEDPPTPSAQAPIPAGPYANIEAGFYWINQAWTIARDQARIPEALPLYTKAEQAFGPHSSMAALAACNRIAQLDNLSDLAQAAQEVFRVEQTYQHVMDIQTRLELIHVKGWVAFDSRDYLTAMQIANELRKYEKKWGMKQLSAHVSGLTQLAIAECLDSDIPERQHLLMQAEQNMRFMSRYAEANGDIVDVGFQHFRLAQILREQRRFSEANHEISYARQCFVGEGAYGHIAIEEANLTLLDGETTRARARAESAQEGWLKQYYAGGLGQIAAVTALSFWMEGHAQQALEPAVVAASIAPNGRCFKGDRFVDLPWQINRNMRHRITEREYAAVIAQTREHIHLRSGYFACLTRVVPDCSGAALALLDKLENTPHP
jgi:transcriptional regulator with XRE-family HTH domain